jgi:hypothetical protein
MDLPDDVINIIFNKLPKTFQCMLSLTCKHLIKLKNINLKSVDVANDGNLLFLTQCKNINKKTWKAAIKNGHIHILEWLNLRHRVSENNICSYAIECTQLETLKWLMYNNFTVNYYTYKKVIRKQNMEIYEYMYPLISEHFCIYSIAASTNSVKILEWLKHNNLLIADSYDSIERFAVENNNVNVLEWLYENGHQFDPNTIYQAPKYGCLDVIKYLVSIGFQN